MDYRTRKGLEREAAQTEIKIESLECALRRVARVKVRRSLGYEAYERMIHGVIDRLKELRQTSEAYDTILAA